VSSRIPDETIKKTTKKQNKLFSFKMTTTKWKSRIASSSFSVLKHL